MKKKPQCYYKLCGCTAGECCCDYYFPADEEEEQEIYEREALMSRCRGYENVGTTPLERAGMEVHDSLLDYALHEQRTNREWMDGKE